MYDRGSRLIYYKLESQIDEPKKIHKKRERQN